MFVKEKVRILDLRGRSVAEEHRSGLRLVLESGQFDLQFGMQPGRLGFD